LIEEKPPLNEGAFLFSDVKRVLDGLPEFRYSFHIGIVYIGTIPTF
jgi:hypothetical protein